MERRILAVVAVLALAAAACGSGGSGGDGVGIASLQGAGSTVAPSEDPELDAEESILALTECLREEGLAIPDPEFDDQGNFRLRSLVDLGEAAEVIDPDDLRAGFEACSHHLDGVAQLVQSIDRTDLEDRMYRYASCMREHGFDMPDPDFDFGPPGEGGGQAQGPFGDIDTHDPAFEEANDACMGVFGETIGPGGFGPAVGPDG